jgi:hypothetical protein|nr:MAG TPA: hypothetical protein [Caudoviricetes sp.]
MKRYKLLKDLPTFKAGDLFYISEYGALVYDDGGFGIMAYAQSTLEKFPNILTEWFEEIQEPTDSIHWKPVIGEEYWSFHSDGGISHNFCTGCYWDTARYEMGRTYRTEEECIRARNRELAEFRLRRTSNFKLDFENDNGGWVVCYYHRSKELDCIRTYSCDSGEPVRYKTYEDAQRSIKENREDWMIYFGIEEER